MSLCEASHETDSLFPWGRSNRAHRSLLRAEPLTRAKLGLRGQLTWFGQPVADAVLRCIDEPEPLDDSRTYV